MERQKGLPDVMAQQMAVGHGSADDQRLAVAQSSEWSLGSHYPLHLVLETQHSVIFDIESQTKSLFVGIPAPIQKHRYSTID
jgi:hypothetical protein